MSYDCWNYCYSKQDPSDCIASKIKNIPTNIIPIEVISCFGGTGIYKREYMDNCSYGNGMHTIYNKTTMICEHLAFNNCIVRNGGRLYINPKFINS